MAKTKTIKDRPMILVTVNAQKWSVGIKDNDFILLQSNDRTKELHPKQETLTSGEFKAFCKARDTNRTYGSWGYLSKITGNVESRWVAQEENSGKDFIFDSVQAIFSKFENVEKFNEKYYSCEICRTSLTYYNPKTHEVTQDRKVADKWFKGKNPLFINTRPYQCAGMWIEPGDNYVEVSFYINDSIKRTKLDPWTKVKEAGFRLYNDGTISHFYKGKYFDTNRPFEENRVTCRTFDPRFRELTGCSANFQDLRSKEIIGPDGSTRVLCPETLQILKDAGFPDTYWCWGNTKRKFRDTYDLVNFITHVQKIKKTKSSESIDEFVALKPFNLNDEPISVFNKGILIRLATLVECWENTETHEISAWQSWRPDLKGKEVKHVKIVEGSRIWISDNGKQRSCQQIIRFGSEWKPCQLGNINWPCKHDYRGEKETAKNLKIYGQFNKYVAHLNLRKAFELLPCLKHINSILENYPQITEPLNFSNLLTALYKAPKITETFIKLGYASLFFEKDDYYYDGTGTKTSFTLNNALRHFGTNERDLKEDKKKSLYQNLGISKEQFKWLVDHPRASTLMREFHDSRRWAWDGEIETRFRIPGKNEERYKEFSQIPVSQLQEMERIAEQIQAKEGRDFNTALHKASSLLEYLPVKEIKTAFDKELNITLLQDYLRLRSQCIGLPRFNIRDWDRMPQDQRDLQFCHNRIDEFHRSAVAYREKARLEEAQKKYEERLKKIKTLAYEVKDNNRIIVIPKELVELVIEGQKLHHCVGSFTESVAAGRDTIVFLRHKDNPEESYATINLVTDGKTWRIDQAHTAYNGSITVEDVDFLKDWAIAKKNIDLNSIDTHYGAKCHH